MKSYLYFYLNSEMESATISTIGWEKQVIEKFPAELADKCR